MFARSTTRASSLFTVLLILLTAPGFKVTAHTFHTSLMRMEFNETEKTVECTLQVYAHDLELALNRRAGKSISLDESAAVDQLIQGYLSEMLVLKNSQNDVKTFSWVGRESLGDTLILYFEAKMPEGLDGAVLTNRLMFDIADDQVNMVNILNRGERIDFAFRKGEETGPIKK
jgi:hypothetical protein